MNLKIGSDWIRLSISSSLSFCLFHAKFRLLCIFDVANFSSIPDECIILCVGFLPSRSSFPTTTNYFALSSSCSLCVCVCLSYSFFIALYNLINNYCAHIYICDACLFPNLIQDFFPMNRFRSCYSICNINTHEYTHRERVNRGRAKSHIKRINTKCTKGKTERECAWECERGREKVGKKETEKERNIHRQQYNNAQSTETHNISCILSEGFDRFVFVLFIHREYELRVCASFSRASHQ